MIENVTMHIMTLKDCRHSRSVIPSLYTRTTNTNGPGVVIRSDQKNCAHLIETFVRNVLPALPKIPISIRVQELAANLTPVCCKVMKYIIRTSEDSNVLLNF